MEQPYEFRIPPPDGKGVVWLTPTKEIHLKKLGEPDVVLRPGDKTWAIDINDHSFRSTYNLEGARYNHLSFSKENFARILDPTKPFDAVPEKWAVKLDNQLAIDFFNVHGTKKYGDYTLTGDHHAYAHYPTFSHGGDKITTGHKVTEGYILLSAAQFAEMYESIDVPVLAMVPNLREFPEEGCCTELNESLITYLKRTRVNNSNSKSSAANSEKATMVSWNASSWWYVLSSTSKPVYEIKHLEKFLPVYDPITNTYDMKADDGFDWLDDEDDDEIVVETPSKKKPFYVVVTEENKDVLHNWRFEGTTVQGRPIIVGKIVGLTLTDSKTLERNYNSAHITKGETYTFGNEITLEQFLELYPEYKEKKRELVHGKWYKARCSDEFCYTIRLDKEKDRGYYAIDYIVHLSDDNRYNKNSGLFHELAEEVSVDDIQEWLPDGHVDKVKPYLIAGRWYKANNCWYLKFRKETERDVHFTERISKDGEYAKETNNAAHTRKAANNNNFVLLEDLSCIQQFLPDGHPDKKVADTDPRIILAEKNIPHLQDNPNEWWKDLKKGDVVECIKSNSSRKAGKLYTLVDDWEQDFGIWYADGFSSTSYDEFILVQKVHKAVPKPQTVPFKEGDWVTFDINLCVGKYAHNKTSFWSENLTLPISSIGDEDDEEGSEITICFNEKTLREFVPAKCVNHFSDIQGAGNHKDLFRHATTKEIFNVALNQVISIGAFNRTRFMLALQDTEHWQFLIDEEIRLSKTMRMKRMIDDAKAHINCAHGIAPSYNLPQDDRTMALGMAMMHAKHEAQRKAVTEAGQQIIADLDNVIGKAMYEQADKVVLLSSTSSPVHPKDAFQKQLLPLSPVRVRDEFKTK